jgi:hypothetical protein
LPMICKSNNPNQFWIISGYWKILPWPKSTKVLNPCLFFSSSCWYYSVVKRRNDKVIKAAVQSAAIVTSLFPSNIRNRLYKDQEEKEQWRRNYKNLSSYLNDKDHGRLGSNTTAASTKPLADLFTDTTVLVRIESVMTRPKYE